MALSPGGKGSAIVLVLFLLRGLGGVVASPFLPAFARVVDVIRTLTDAWGRLGMIVAVAVAVGTSVAVLVGVVVGLGVWVLVGVWVGVLVGVLVGRSVGVLVGMSVGVGVAFGEVGSPVKPQLTNQLAVPLSRVHDAVKVLLAGTR